MDMIRRIILFLGLLFVSFFAYRRYDKVAADLLLAKIKNFSFSSSNNYTTTISDTNGSGVVIVSDAASGLLEKLSDTMLDKTATVTPTPENEQALQQILIQEKLEQGVSVPGLTGKVIVQTGTVETISAQPIISPKASSTSKTSTTTTLSSQDKREAEEFSQLFSD